MIKFLFQSIGLLPFVLAALHAASDFNVRDFGATGAGVQNDAVAINRAVGACAAAGGGTVLIPAGRYLTGTIRLLSHVTLQIDAGATVLGSENPADYPVTQSIWGDNVPMMASLIYAEDAENIAVTGRGTIDGQGKIWWRRLEMASPRRGRPGPQTAADRDEVAKLSRGRPHLIRFVRCRDVLIRDVNLLNSAEWNVHPMACENVRIEGISIFAPPSEIGPGSSHNTDGINPESCRDVRIVNCRIDNGDDCVTLKSGIDVWGRRFGRPTENVTISNCTMYHGHGGVTIGSEMSGGVRNVTITNCVFTGTGAGIRIKSQRGRGGVVEGIVASNIVMQDVPVPFIITTFYSGKDSPGELHPVDEGTPRYRDIHFSNITARGAKVAGSITGLREMPITDVTFSQVRLQAKSGFTCTNARDIGFFDTRIDTAAGPALQLTDTAQIVTAGLTTRSPHSGVPLILNNSSAP